jgi:hypothetical protein
MAGSRTLKLSILGDVDNLNKSLKSATSDVETFGDKVGKVGKVVGAAFVAAAAAAGAYAVKIGIDGVKAAIEDEKAQTQLALALENATGATKGQIAATEQSILKMSLATGVADDNLRPALQRLALSTGNISKAQDLLATALDVSAATGKPLETVANALGKAYDGNTAALGKLGIGLSATELKTMSFTDVQDQLTTLFGGAAAANAETYSGRIDRMKVAFNEAKETIGFALLPILETVMKFINDNALPVINKFADAFGNKNSGLTSYIETLTTFLKNLFTPIIEGLVKAFGYVKDAIGDNLKTFQEFGGYIAKYLAPIIGETLGGALQVVGKVAAGVINIVADVVGAINKVINVAIDGINFLIRAYNSVPFLGNVNELGKITFNSGGVATGGAPGAISGGGISGGGTSGGSGFSAGGGTSGGSSGGSSSSGAGAATNAAKSLTDLVSKLTGVSDNLTELQFMVDTGAISKSAGTKQLNALVKQFDVLSKQADALGANAGTGGGSSSGLSGLKTDSASNVTNIYVTGAIDKEGTARTISETLNNSYYRGTGGALNLVGVTP